jgi:hypothetical protein
VCRHGKNKFVNKQRVAAETEVQISSIPTSRSGLVIINKGTLKFLTAKRFINVNYLLWHFIQPNIKKENHA